MKRTTRTITLALTVRSQCNDAEVLHDINEVLIHGRHPKSLDDNNIEIQRVVLT